MVPPLGVETTGTTGWVEYPVDEAIRFTTKMLLKRGKVEELIEHLQEWEHSRMDITQNARAQSEALPSIGFRDTCGALCSITPGFVETDHALWMGINNANPQCMAVDAKRLGVETTDTAGWIKYPIDKKVLLTTRMLLKRDQVEKLVKHLQQWLSWQLIKDDAEV